MINLSEYIKKKSNCIHCLMDKCKNHKIAATDPIKVMSKYVNNPLLIKDVEEDMKSCKIQITGYQNKDILKNGFMYTTCIFCILNQHQDFKCKNMREGRFGKCTTKDGKVITYCYPDLKSVKHRIQIGLHMDLSITFGTNDNNIKFEYLAENEKKVEKVEEEIVEKVVKVEEEVVKVEVNKVSHMEPSLIYSEDLEAENRELKRIIMEASYGSSNQTDYIKLKSYNDFLEMKIRRLCELLYTKECDLFHMIDQKSIAMWES